MSTYVLVPGMTSGGWSWKAVAGYLRDAGHEVYRCTLTGLGERSHLASREIGLETHIEDVVNVFKYEDLSGVVLVGSSYAGKVVAGVADRIPDRLSHVVYMDSGVFNDGESGLEQYPILRPRIEAALAGDGFVAPSASAEPRATPHPARTLTDKIRLGGHGAKVPSTYILCTRKAPEVLSYQDEAVRRSRDRGWRVMQLDCVHEAALKCPRELADLLLQVS